MSAGAPALGGPGAPVPAAAPASRTPTARVAADRPWLRLGAFAALGAYGLGRWATMLGPAPGWRLFGLLAVAVALAGGVPLLARRSRVVAGVTAFLLLFVTFPIAGVRWEWFRHLRIKVSAEFIGTGLERLPNVIVPYVGHDRTIRLVIVLGAAVLLLDAAAVLGFSGRAGGRGGSGFSDARRAAAALPLIALAIVPSTLIRPQLPYVQGLILFGLLVLFVWGERISSPAHPAAASAVTVLALVGVAGALAAPRIDPRSPWVNYRAWAGGVVRHRIDTFNWNQSYGPLVWPHAGHVVLDVRARFAEYWKAQDLDTFDGWRWVQSSPVRLLLEPALPSPSRRALARWSQTIQVTIQGMRTQDVIAAGTALQPSPLPGGVARGADAGTWVAGEPLGPGATYQVTTYTPHPGAAALAHAGTRYPAQLGADLTLAIPQQKPFEGPALQVQFPLFHTAGKPTSFEPGYVPDAAPVVLTSPYARAYRLARRLEAQAATPYAYVAAVARYLSRGFTYSNNPPVRAYPLESFLFSDRRGYCQQFSGAMALLLRMGGIPARVAAGFTSGTRDPSAHEWVVSDIDAHAWVEVWFPHYGWIRFDPTPGGPTTTGGAAATAAVQKRLPTAETLLKENMRAPQDAVPTIPTGGGHARGGGGVSAWPFALGAALALLLAAGGRLALRFRGDADALLAELERALSRSGRPLRGGVTLVALERRLIASPEAAAYVRTLRHARYGGAGRLPTAAQRRALRRELGRGLGMSGRLRALWALPPRF